MTRGRRGRATPVRLDRRRFLQGSLIGGGTAALGLPLLETMLDGNGAALADGSELPMRFGTFFWGGGVYHPSWVPREKGQSWPLSECLEPFGSHDPSLREYLTLLTKVNHPRARPAHIPARGVALSASHDTTWVQRDNGAGYRGQANPEPSVDVIVRDAWRGCAGARDSVHIAITRAGPYHGNSSWERGGRAVNAPDTSPAALYSTLFTGGVPAPMPGDERGTARLRLIARLERSMLDAVREDAARVRRELGANDRVRIDDHLESLRALERRIMDYQARLDGGGEGLACEDPGQPTSSENAGEKSRLMSDTLATALACDLTRVFSYEWSANQSGYVYREIGVSGGHHNDITHRLQSRTADQTKIIRYIMEAYAYLGESLRRLPEAGGNVLDRTLILGTSEHANPQNHRFDDHPFALVGKAGGAIRAGIHWEHPNPEETFGGGNGNTDGARVLLTAVRAVGVPLEQLGMPATRDSRGTELASRVVTESISEILT